MGVCFFGVGHRGAFVNAKCPMPPVCSVVQETRSDVDTDVLLDSEEGAREAGTQTLRYICI